MSIPIFIITRDRVSPLRQLLNRLDSYWDDIVLVDNDSTYAPMVEFLETTGLKVCRLQENMGHKSPWAAGLVPSDGCYAVTDPDVVPVGDCPDDFVYYLQDVVQSHPTALKAGLGLCITDLPDCYKYKTQVQQWEHQFWLNPIDQMGGTTLYGAPLDTTFAVYRQSDTIPDIYPAIRSGEPYVARHLPWYVDSENPTEEDVYYKDHASRAITSWMYDELSPAMKGVFNL